MQDMGWDDEEPTVVEARPAAIGRIDDWNDRTGTWSAFDDAGIRRAFRSDPAPTCLDLPAVTLKAS